MINSNKLKYIYIISVIFKKHNDKKEIGISSEGYLTLKEAQNFIETRSGNIEKINDFLYYDKNNNNDYHIHEIQIKNN